jgi:hypothetical protein
LTERFWLQECDKNLHTLLDTILDRADYDTLETDVVLGAGNPLGLQTDSLSIGQRAISLHEIQESLKSGEMVQYFYVYCDYQSYWDDVFNTLLVVHTIDSVWLDDQDHLQHAPKKPAVVEKYRWDIQLDKVREIYEEQGL